MQTQQPTKNSTPLWARGAADLAAAIRSGEISSEEAVEAHIARIEAVNGALNAVVVKRFAEARKEAKQADAARRLAGRMGPLHGVPVTVKECLDLAGTPSSTGIPSLAGREAAADDPYVARLREAGAIVLGKTNLAQCLLFVESDNPVYGRANNPWDLTRTPGGSSGGEAAIIAAGGSPLGFGTDIGGSGRIPATWCGIASMKPTAGRTPDQGRRSVPIGQQAIVSQVGAFARSVADVSLGLRVIESPNETAPALGDYTSVDVSKLRVGYFTDDGVFAPSPAVVRAVQEAAEMLRARGATVVKWQPPSPELAGALVFGIFASDGLAGLKRILGKDKRSPQIAKLEQSAGATGFMHHVVMAILKSSGRKKLAQIVSLFGDLSADGYWRRAEAVMDYRTRFAAALDAVDGGPLDLILSPMMPLPALKHGATVELIIPGTYSALYNVLGYPAGVVPVTRVRPAEEASDRPGSDKMDITARASDAGSAGLPVGVQIAARPWRDHLALGAMQAIEEAAQPMGIAMR